MGAITKIDIFDSLDPNEIISLLKTSGFIVFAADLKGEKTIYEFLLKKKSLWLWGLKQMVLVFLKKILT